jgi:tetratricopeptide (TPR) repeat protein
MTLAPRIACLLLAAGLAFGQNNDIFDRVLQVLGPSGEQAEAELRKGNFGPVQEMLRAAPAADARARAELLSVQGAVAFLAGDMRASAADFAAAAAIQPLEETDTFTRAMALVNLHDDKGARTLIEDLAAKHPDHAVYIYWLGRLDYDQRRYDEAIVKLKRALELDPNSTRAWNSLGNAYDMQGQMERALNAFRKATELNRNLSHPSPWPPHDLGFLLLRMEKPDEAEAALRESLRYDSKLAQTHYYLGRVLEKEGQDTAAINEYAIAVSSDQASPEACYSLGKLYRKVHRDADANNMFAEYKRRKEALAGTPQ